MTGSRFLDLASNSMCFCNFSKALFSICLTLSLLILYFWLKSSNVVGLSFNLLEYKISLSLSFKILNEREREILYSRRLNDNPTTLEDLSKKFKISRERVRQIENKSFEKLQKHMLLLAKSKNLLPVN